MKRHINRDPLEFSQQLASSQIHVVVCMSMMPVCFPLKSMYAACDAKTYLSGGCRPLSRQFRDPSLKLGSSNLPRWVDELDQQFPKSFIIR